ncbi:hypothetical protein [Variovorax sp. LT1R16]|uniref:hypothetical protein n=1 Tax=Variovorax sp. LT1R16 TaxID=3443728 RepID=UPI003F484803
MQLLGIRTAGGQWSWVLRSADGAQVIQSTRTFSSYVLSMIDASCVCDHLQTAQVECADYIAIPALRGMQRDR